MNAPLQYLSGAGDKATPVVALTWGVLIISVVVDRHHQPRCWRARSGAGRARPGRNGRKRAIVLPG